METIQYSIADLHEEIRTLKESNQRLEKAFMAVSMIMEQHMLPKKSAIDSLTREFERKLRKSRPQVLKEKIIRYFEENPHTDLADARFYIVEQMRYTSKATFYRYIGELVNAGHISKSHKGSKVIISPVMKTIKEKVL
ncbi:MAG: hypothetical protein ACMXYL_02350 [Candidatus Woesearchaeota archaeon]